MTAESKGYTTETPLTTPPSGPATTAPQEITTMQTLTTAHIEIMLLPTIARANAAGWLLVNVRVAGTVGALILVVDFMHAELPLFMELELTALHLGAGVHYGSMFVSVADAHTEEIILARKVGEFLQVM